MDPVRRQIYDSLGEKGLVASNALQKRFNSVDELRFELERLLKKKNDTFSFISKGQLTCGLDATGALKTEGIKKKAQGIKKTLLRVEHKMGVRKLLINIDNTTDILSQLRFSNNTDVTLTGEMQASPLFSSGQNAGNLIGTIRHQFSPRIEFQGSANLYRSHKLNLKTAYSDDDNSLAARVEILPWRFPRFALEIQRRLFPTSHTTGTLTVTTGRIPTFTAMIGIPLESDRMFMWGAGVRAAPLPSLIVDATTKSIAGGLRGRLAAEWGLLGLKGTVYGLWSGPQDSVVSVAVGSGNVGPLYTEISIQISGHQLAFPIILSYEADVMIGLCAMLVPSAMAGLTHSLLIRPWLRARRLSQLQNTLKIHGERIKQKKKDTEQTIDMLSDHAHRRVEHERNIGGLVILKGTYIAGGEEDEEMLSIDVTVPLQVQVHDSQLIIPGGRSKAGLVGFYDPLPGTRKRLKIEYLFHEAFHVVDVEDLSPIILPLRAPPFTQYPLPAAMQQLPTCTNTRIITTDDAHRIFHAAGVLRILGPMVHRRLDAEERRYVRPGSVFVWEERSTTSEAAGLGIERWTDGLRWGPSRVRDFLFYQEKFTKAEGNEVLTKQTYSAWVNLPTGPKKWHLSKTQFPFIILNDPVLSLTLLIFLPSRDIPAAYFTQATINSMKTVDDIPCMKSVTAPPGMYRRSRCGKKRKETRRLYPVDLPSPVSDPHSSGDEPPYPLCVPFDSLVASPTPPPFVSVFSEHDGNNEEDSLSKSIRNRNQITINKFTCEKRKVINGLAPLSYLQSLHHPRRSPADEVVLRAFASIN
ncbi:hypothetical protein Clacol_004753 [Clathrus columnatus]|uniref:Uncharacterized protein n=1 Tax=Clathrus columnatus TaxID=1419009 RepID=A0AAV5AAC4_9AGAM|nr:hypothetical protein Clacol_004753 [Clathrus columnatus]